MPRQPSASSRLLLAATSVSGPGLAHEPRNPTRVLLPSAQQVGAGRAAWVDSSPGDLLNAQVDLGTIREVEGEFEVTMKWQVTRGIRNDFRLQQPEIRIPEGSVMVDRERIRCAADGFIFYGLQTEMIAPDVTARAPAP